MHDTVIVLGGGLNQDDTLPEDMKYRIELASDCLRNKKVSSIIFSGGYSYKSAKVPDISEAQLAKNYAISLGLPENKLFVEDKSQNTVGNILFVKTDYLIPNLWSNLLIIEAPNHMDERVEYILKKVLGPNYTYTIENTKQNNDPANIERETKSLNLFKKWIGTLVDGDHEAILEMLKQKHPAFSDNSEYSIDQIKELLGENNQFHV